MSTAPFWGPDLAARQAEDPEIADVVLGELDRLRGGLQLIASESLTSPAVLAALGSTLDTHLALIDLREVGVTGKEAEARCDAARITLNENAIPYDPQPPMTASGIRVGTPAVTTQRMAESDLKEVAALIGRAVRDPNSTDEVAAGGRRLVEAHPAYPR